jgi:hypothetical protein
VQGGIAVIALVVAGVLLLFLGIFAAGNFAMMVLGVVALIAAGTFEVLAQRRS